MDYRFCFKWWWEVLIYDWFYCLEQYHILEDYEMLYDFIWFWFYDMYVLRLSASMVSPCHCSCVAGHGPEVRVAPSRLGHVGMTI